MDNITHESAKTRPVFKRRSRGLLLSYNCNLACSYCYIDKKCDKIMPFEVAQKAVSGAFESSESFCFHEVEIDFAGAEPLTAFDRLKQVSEWIWSKNWPKPYVLFATTNGTLLNQEMREWFTRYKDRISLGLSFDGDADTQNQNRSESFSAVDLDFFLNTWPNQPVKMTISENTVWNLAQDIISLHKKGFQIMANPANGMKAWSRQSISEFARQLSILIDFYLKNPDIKRVSFLSLDLKAILSSSCRFGNKYCGAGLAYDVIDVDGRSYPCHMFSPLVQTEERISGLKNIDFTAREPFLCEMCSKCILNPICPSCYGLNYKRTGDSARRELSLCRLFTLQVMANCKYNIRVLKEKNCVSNNEYETIKAIRKIYNFFYDNGERR